MLGPHQEQVLEDEDRDATPSPAEALEIAPTEPPPEPEHVLVFQAILDGIPAPIFYKDAEGVYRGCNRAFREYLGRAHAEIVGKTVYDVAPPHLAATYDAADRALLAARGVQVYESAVRYADGSLRDVVFHKGVFLSVGGAVGGQVGTILDVTARKRAEEAQRESEERYRAVVAALDEGILLKDREGRTLASNAAAERVLGVSAEQLAGHVGTSATRWIQDERGQPFDDATFPSTMTLRTGEPQSNVIARLTRKDGTLVWVSMNSRPLFREGEPLPYAVVLTLSDISERKYAEDRLEHQAFFDALTGLPNRALFERRLAEALATVSREEGIAVLFVGLDRFKSVNDTLGHGGGDALLRQVASRLGEHVRGGDTLARMGGDEFTCVLRAIPDVTAAARIAERILDACRAPFEIAGAEIFLGASVGVSLWPLHGDNPAQLLRGADSALYEAKSSGKDRYRIYSSDMASAAAEVMTLEASLHRALERDELTLHYQPKLDATTLKLVGFEALVRWRHPTRGLVPPNVFIPVAEKSGLIVRLGAWVLRRACEQTAAWTRAGHAPPRMAVNVSARQFDDGAFIEQVSRTLGELDLPAEQLEIELTEGVIMRNVVDSSQQLEKLRALGVRIAIDDFGTGYSSLSYLQRLPIDLVKIDRSFVKDMDEKPSTLPLVQAIIALAHSLGIEVIAEGVETEEQLASLRRLACDQVQGFLLGKPVPAEEAAARWFKR